MNNTQQDDITADLTDERLASAAADAFNKYLKTNPQIASNQACRAVAALAREGWQLIPQVVPPAADKDSQELGGQLRELAEILTRMGCATTTGTWPSRLQRAAELLVHQQAFQPVPTFSPRPPAEGEVGELVARLREGGRSWLADQYRWAAPMRRAANLLEQRPVPASERPWEQEGWCDEQGRCWMADPGDEKIIPSWHLCRPKDATRMIWSLSHWAIFIPASTNTSS